MFLYKTIVIWLFRKTKESALLSLTLHSLIFAQHPLLTHFLTTFSSHQQSPPAAPPQAVAAPPDDSSRRDHELCHRSCCKLRPSSRRELCSSSRYDPPILSPCFVSLLYRTSHHSRYEASSFNLCIRTSLLHGAPSSFLRCTSSRRHGPLMPSPPPSRLDLVETFVMIVFFIIIISNKFFYYGPSVNITPIITTPYHDCYFYYY